MLAKSSKGSALLLGAAVAVAKALALVAPLSSAHAQQQPATAAVFTCVNAKGQQLRSDRPIAECMDREQRVLNRDGSVQRIVPPALTMEERAAKEAQERQAAAARELRREAERADRNLLQRYPNEAAHMKAREAALEQARNSIALAQSRLKALDAERKPLNDEAEFYVGKPLPAKLKAKIDANDAATEAQNALIASQQAEVSRISLRYDVELFRLRKLWSGVVPGTLGPLAGPDRQGSLHEGAPKPTAQR